MIRIRKRDYYFECRCNRKFHVRKRKFVDVFYCPICDYRTIPLNVIRKITKKQIEAMKELRRSNKQVLKELGIKK